MKENQARFSPFRKKSMSSKLIEDINDFEDFIIEYVEKSTYYASFKHADAIIRGLCEIEETRNAINISEMEFARELADVLFYFYSYVLKWSSMAISSQAVRILYNSSITIDVAINENLSNIIFEVQKLAKEDYKGDRYIRNIVDNLRSIIALIVFTDEAGHDVSYTECIQLKWREKSAKLDNNNQSD